MRAARGAIVAFSDANASWEPDALRALVAPFARPRASATSAGRCASSTTAGTNQEGLYWRYEMWIRALESRLASVTAGNGAIYAVRREAYIEVDPVMGHDLSFPFNMVKRGLARGLRAGGARDGEDGALDRGRVRPQAADDEPRLADRPARRDALVRAATAAVRADDRLAPRAALRARRFLHVVALGDQRRARSHRRRGIYVVALRGPGRAAGRRAARAGRPGAPVRSSRATTC